MARREAPVPVAHGDNYGNVPYGGGGTPAVGSTWEALHGLQFIGGEVGELYTDMPVGPEGPEPDLSGTIVVPADYPECANPNGVEQTFVSSEIGDEAPAYVPDFALPDDPDLVPEARSEKEPETKATPKAAKAK